MTLVHILIVAVIVAACVGIAAIAIRQTGLAIPAWVVQIFWIVVVAFVAIFAIRFVAGF